VGAVEVAGGASGGTVPVQSLWYLGGPFSLRGYDGAAAAGEEFWRARAEVANDFPAVRLALFADAGSAAPRGALTTRDALLGVGAGLSFFDGMMRLDVARATRAPTGWRVDFYFDGVTTPAPLRRGAASRAAAVNVRTMVASAIFVVPHLACLPGPCRPSASG
jgi:hypothetical protein